MRKTARALGMRTEASARFEKGVDIMNVEYAMNRALQLIDELDAGNIVEGAIDVNDGLPEERVLTVTAGRDQRPAGACYPGRNHGRNPEPSAYPHRP